MKAVLTSDLMILRQMSALLKTVRLLLTVHLKVHPLKTLLLNYHLKILLQVLPVLFLYILL